MRDIRIEIDGIPVTPSRIAHNDLKLYIPPRINKKKELDGLAPASPACLGHDHSCRKWRAIRETAGASVNLANVSMGAYHITVKTLDGKFLT